MARILVIDDEELVRFTLQEILKSAGHEIVVAGNGREGVEVFNKQPCDLVVTDIIMPEKEGVETIIELRKVHPGLKVIAISGGGRTRNFDFLDLAQQFGADVTLSKPFGNKELLQAVDELLAV